MLFEPAFGLRIIRTDRSNLLPVPLGMIRLPAMHQLMQDDVFLDMIRCLNQSPV